MNSLVGYADDEDGDPNSTRDLNEKAGKTLSDEPPRLKNPTPAKSLKSQIMAAVRKPMPSKNATASSSRPDPVGFATAQLQGTSLARDRLRGSPSTTKGEQHSLRTTLIPAAVDGVDNWGIPPAKTQSYEPELQEKLDRFYELKVRGKHFNDSLMSNKAFRNPHLYAKLVEFVDVNEDATNFPHELWDPHDVRKEWFAESLAEAQKLKYEQLQAAQAPGKRTKIDFTSASSSKGKRNDHSRKGQAENRWMERDEDERYRPYPQDAARYRSNNDRGDAGSGRHPK